MMRKFHASQLRESGLDMDTIDALQGRSKTPVRKSYFFDNPENIRSEYIKHMDCLTINLDVNSIDIKVRNTSSLKMNTKTTVSMWKT